MTGPAGAPAAPLIELRGVGVRYRGAASAAIESVDLVIGHGELVTLAGPAGSGKSTLLGVMGLLLRPTAGSYLLNGIDTARLGDREQAGLRARQIACVLQRPPLLRSRSALDNVMLGALYSGLPRPRRQDAAIGALHRVGMAAGPQAIAGRLAAGDQQRVAIARALAAGPSLLLCDDPTASLDRQAAEQVVGLLVSLRRDGRTVVVATRDQLAAAYSSRHLVVGAGRGPGG